MRPYRSKTETCATVHVILLVVFSSWAFGGGAGWAQTAICISGSLAPLITFAAVREIRVGGHSLVASVLPLVPLIGFNLLVLIGTLQPSLRTTTIEGGQVFLRCNNLTFWPSSARPELALKALWLFDVIALSSYNLLLAIRHRRMLRALLFALAANAFALSVFGSLQKFVGAGGLFFNQVPSPNPSFFASFIYHNHWGAFVVLMLAISLGLLFNLRPWSGYRDFWHSPALVAVVAIFFLAVTVPLSASRSCSLLAVLLLTAAMIHGLRRVALHQREFGKSTQGPLIGVVLTMVVAAVFLFVLTRQTIETRVGDTQVQFARMRAEGSIGDRARLYDDTWRMALDRPWFGWGLGSYGTVFSFYNTQHAVDNLPQYYEDAHSDWLQLFAETGAIGTSLLLGFLVLPLLSMRTLRGASALPCYLFAGCGLILLYAGVEFPFGNPAVTLTFWTCFFVAVRWVQIDQREQIG